jgi:hypothetical protein
MRRILLALSVVVFGQAAHANDFSGVQLAQAQANPGSQPAPSSPASATGPAQTPAPQAATPSEPQAPAALQAIPPTASGPGSGQPGTEASKPVKKHVARRERSWRSSEARARAIAAKYGISW